HFCGEERICATSTASITRIVTTPSTSSFRQSAASRKTQTLPTSLASSTFRPKDTKPCLRTVAEDICANISLRLPHPWIDSSSRSISRRRERSWVRLTSSEYL